jgi:hypothetical protein
VRWRGSHYFFAILKTYQKIANEDDDDDDDDESKPTEHYNGTTFNDRPALVQGQDRQVVGKCS